MLPFSFCQTTDFNCAAGAVAFFANAQSGLVLDVDKVTRKLGSTPERGTDHEAIVGYLDFLFRYDGVRLEHGHGLPLHTLTLPLLVNYWTGEDGHYGVVTGLTLVPGNGSWMTLFDPSSGDLLVKDWDEFVRNWYSKRYGPHWGLYIARKAS